MATQQERTNAGMKVAFFTGFTTWVPHYETELELIQQHLDAGHQVVQLHCSAELFACDANLHHTRLRCERCITRRQSGLELVQGRFIRRSYLHLNASDRADVARHGAMEPATLDELKAIRYGPFDLGYAVLSSLISHLREPRPDLRLHRSLVQDLLRSGLAVFCSIRNTIERERFDRFYVFNGRFAIERAVLRACQEKGVECCTHERGHDLSHYTLYPNTMPHDLAYWRRAINEAWEAEPDAERRTGLARRFYEDRARGQVQSWYSFVAEQSPGALPEGFDPKKRNIVIFNSSEDEFAAIDSSHGSGVYVGQEEAIRMLAQDLEKLGGGYRLYLRTHPNLRSVDNSQTRFLREFRSPGITIIPADSPVSTYALMQAADLVLTFGSTMGIEAAFWGKPSIMVGTAFYGGLGSVYEPRSHEEVVRMIDQGVPPLPIEGALRYGYRMSTFGTKFIHYRPSGVASGTFKGRTLGVDPMAGRSGRFSMLFWWRAGKLAGSWRHHYGRLRLLGLRRWMRSST